MQLNARKKRDATRPITLEKQAEVVAKREIETTKSRYNESIYIRCNAMLYNTMQNMIVSAHTAEDFTYVSVADLIRAALQAYKDGMSLTELSQKGEKIGTTIRVDKELKDFYTSLPDRMKTRLVERVIRTFLKQ